MDSAEIEHHLEKYYHHASCVLLVGSRAEGYATENSDVDLIVITDSPEYYGVESKCYSISASAGIKFEILIVTQEDMNLMIIKSFESNDFYSLQKILFGEIKFGKCSFDRKKLQTDFDKRYYCKNTDQALKMYSALAGLKNNCHLQQYAFSLKKYLEKMTEIYLFCRGDRFIKTKWLISRLLRVEKNNSELLQEFFIAINYKIENEKDMEELESIINNVVALMQYKALSKHAAQTDFFKHHCNIRFFTMERDGEVIVFTGGCAFRMVKVEAIKLIEDLLIADA
ncbi:nucleotidyltransferase domain-containing protein [Erwinia sp. MYb375]|uniref:nucleotidyltransferase domain-containing protein n=1 Tax=unclassified Erwinia TaxID=2622719 RepID=UPI0030A45906